MEKQDYVKICLGMQSHTVNSLYQYIPHGVEFKYFAGESIVSPADDNYVYLITHGSFKLTATQLDGSVYDIAYCHKDSIIQINLCTHRNPYMDPVHVVATENSVVVRFSRHQFYQFVQTDEELFNDLVDTMSTYSGMLRERLFLTSNVSSSQRILNWLEKLSLSQHPDKDGVYTIQCDMTQQQIANLLFIHITTCNKVFAKLNKEKIAGHFRGKVVIYDLEKLRVYRDQKLKLL